MGKSAIFWNSHASGCGGRLRSTRRPTQRLIKPNFQQLKYGPLNVWLFRVSSTGLKVDHISIYIFISMYWE